MKPAGPRFPAPLPTPTIPEKKEEKNFLSLTYYYKANTVAESGRGNEAALKENGKRALEEVNRNVAQALPTPTHTQ